MAPTDAALHHLKHRGYAALHVLHHPLALVGHALQYVSVKYTERIAEAGLVPSVGSVRDSYDNPLAETVDGKAKVIHRRGAWRSLAAVEFATLEWVYWFNNRRCSHRTATCRQRKQMPATMPAWRSCAWPPDSNQTASGEPGAVQCGLGMVLLLILLTLG